MALGFSALPLMFHNIIFILWASISSSIKWVQKMKLLVRKAVCVLHGVNQSGLPSLSFTGARQSAVLYKASA